MNPASLAIVLASTFFAYLLLFNLQRQKLSYFYNIRSLFYTWTIFFILLAYSRIFFSSITSPEIVVYRTKVSLTISSLMAMIFGSLAAIVGHYTETKSVQEFLSKIFKKPYPLLLIYYIICVACILPLIFTTPFHVTELKNLLTGDVEYAAVYETWYKFLIVSLGVAVLLYPCLTFFKVSKQLKSEKIRKSLRIFVVSLVTYTLSSPLLTIIRRYGYSEYELIYLCHAVLLAVMWYGFKESTVFSRFFEETPYPKTSRPLSKSLSEDMSNAFSQPLKISHHQLIGRKILLEFDVTSNYEEIVKNFVSECQTNGGMPIIFTRKGSSVHASITNRAAVQLLLLTTNVSVPTLGSLENETLLPAEDTSLMLNALSKLIEIRSEKVCVVYDNISELMFSVGFERAYAFVRYFIEMLDSFPQKITALFLLNPEAHDEKVVSSLRGLFRDQIAYEKGRLIIIKLSESSLKE